MAALFSSFERLEEPRLSYCRIGQSNKSIDTIVQLNRPRRFGLIASIDERGQDMSTHGAIRDDAPESGSVTNVRMNLEVVVIPVSNVDRAKEFYLRLGWRLDADRTVGNNFRLIQFAPPGSGCSIQFGLNLTLAVPGSAQASLLVVSDIVAAHQQLVACGIDASEIFHCASGTGCRFQGIDGRVSGLHPERLSYGSFVSFDDPEGNGWLLQEVTERLPGRV